MASTMRCARPVVRCLRIVLPLVALIHFGCSKDDGPISPPQDETPPSTITDLRTIAADSTSVAIAWTTPGDDGVTGTAAHNEFRYSTRHDSPWDSMDVFPTAHLPRLGGKLDTLVVTGLLPDTAYRFRMRVADDAMNWSAPSNAADTTTGSRAGPNHAADLHWWAGFGKPPRGNGLDGEVRALIVHDGHLIAAGEFAHAGQLAVNHVASWDGERWTAMGEGLPGRVHTLAEFQGELVAGGWFGSVWSDRVSCVMRWTGAAWEPLGPSLVGDAMLLQPHGSNLYVSGSFPEGNGFYGFARWDGEVWHKAGGIRPEAMVSHGESLFLGGWGLGGFSEDSIGIVARWNPTGVEPVCYASNVGSVYCCAGVWALHSWNGLLIAGGGGLYDPGFEMVGGFDGSSWRRLDFDSGWLDEIISTVNCFATWQGKLVAGGYFRLTRRPSSFDIVVYDGASWTALGSGIGHYECEIPEFCHPQGNVFAMAEFNGSLYVAGSFRKAGESPSWNIARWDP